jgi:sugar lactone lactonase YvrE
VALDGDGNLLVADSGNDTIRRVTPAGVVTTLAGAAGVAGSVDGSGTAARFNFPVGLAMDGAGNLYVTDSGNQTLRLCSPGGAVTTLAGCPGLPGGQDGTGGTAGFNDPRGVAMGGDGCLYVADPGNDTLRRVTPGGVVTTLAGVAGVAGTTLGDLPAGLSAPDGVAFDPANGGIILSLPNAILAIGP